MIRIRKLRADQGDTLIEILVTIVIVGIAVVAVVGGVATLIFTTSLHRQQSSEQTLLRSYADAVEANQTWTACSATSTGTYNPGVAAGSIGWTVPSTYAGYTAQATAVRYWNGTAFTTTPCGPDSSDTGLRQISLKVSSSRAAETMDVNIRCLGTRGSSCQ